MTEPTDTQSYVRVYLVSAGEYSDYNVWCVFLYKEDAEHYIAQYEKNLTKDGYHQHPFIEERDMWTAPPILASDDRHGASDDWVFDPQTEERRGIGSYSDIDEHKYWAGGYTYGHPKEPRPIREE